MHEPDKDTEQRRNGEIMSFGMWIQVLGAFLAVVSLAVMFDVPKRYLVYDGIAAAAGWLVYLLLINHGMVETVSMYLATIVIALLSHLFARIFKAPVTVFLIPGMLPLVPGVGMYRMVYYLVIGNNEVATRYLSQTLQLAGMIALAVFTVDSVFRMLNGKK